LSVERESDGQFSWQVPDGWQQGRGAWGGLVAGACVDAVQKCESDPERIVRSISLTMFGPVPVGTNTLVVTDLRLGKSLSTRAVNIADGSGQSCATATVVTAKATSADLAPRMAHWSTVTSPSLPRWQDVDVVPKGIPGLPRFMDHLEFRIVDGVPLTSGKAACAGFVRFPDQGAWDVAQLIAIVDAWFPTSLVAFDAPRMIATVAFTAHLTVDPDTLPAGEPLAFTSHLTTAFDGHTCEIRRLWTPDGRIAVENHQSIVVMG
jgi:Thioesterase-like superfamily